MAPIRRKKPNDFDDMNKTDSETNKKPLLILAGPTAVGKTECSLLLAEKLGGEIISADSMQVYKGMDIGTAKALPEERKRVRHHLIDVCSPTEEYNVVRYKEEASAAIDDICSRGKIPILTGGTGFYIQAVLKDTDFTENASDRAYREMLEETEREQPGSLYKMLLEADPKAALEIHPNNIKRVVRALEFHHASGECISDHNAREKERVSPYSFLFVVLERDREELYRRIDRRVDQMLEDGLYEETVRLRTAGCARNMVSMQGLGYKEMLAYIDGETSYEETVRLIKRNTRHYAKRQLTWFKRIPDTIWLDCAGWDNAACLSDHIISLWKNRQNNQE